jgi:hypothetical protein
MKRPREVATKEEFHKIIQGLFPESIIVWKNVPQSEEPPDWYLKIDNDCYAVEATTIEDFIQLADNEFVSIFGITHTLTSFINGIEKTANEQGLLSGTYFISINPIPDFVYKKKIIKKKLLGYIRETKHLPSTRTHKIADLEGHKVIITKGPFNKDSVTGGVITSVRIDSEAQEKLLRAISHSLVVKSKKLSNVAEPKILLILDRYPFSDMLDWTSIVKQCQERENFCCICLIHPPDKSVILWANSPIWKAISIG